MDRIDVKTALGVVDEEPVYRVSEFDYAKYDATTAFGRLQVVRKEMKMLKRGINENSRDMPISTRRMYDKVIDLMKQIEKTECDTIRFGE